MHYAHIDSRWSALKQSTVIVYGAYVLIHVHGYLAQRTLTLFFNGAVSGQSTCHSRA